MTVAATKATTVSKAAPKAAAKLAAAPLTTMTKYRALFLVLAGEQGFKHTQASTWVDVYSKGNEVITMSWGAGQLKGFTHTSPKGKVIVEGQQAAKLQKAQTAMGKPMANSAKWNLAKAKLAELEALGLATFKVIEPKA